MGRRSASDLREDPDVKPRQGKRDLPVNTALGQLTTLEGQGLEITTRTDTALAHAAAFAYIYTSIYHSAYVRGRIEQVERLAISREGAGRRDLIDTVKAGGPMPENYLESASGEFSNLRDE